jgi:F-type H+-transporting ATPase subunit delta
MAELSTIARPYAEAAFRVATAKPGDLAPWSALISEFSSVAQTPEMSALVLDPKVSKERVYGVFAGVIKSPMSKEAQNFLRLLIDNDRVSALPEVAAQFTALKNAREGTADAFIESAFPLNDAQVAELMTGLSRKFGGLKLNARVNVDAGLIGGVRVTVGDEVFDTSVRSQLERMRTTLTAP